MNKPVFRVVGLDHSTCESEYDGAETATQPTQADRFGTKLSIYSPSEPETVTIHLSDMLAAFPLAASNRFAWVQDFADDPVVISKDLYEVLLAYRRMKNAA